MLFPAILINQHEYVSQNAFVLPICWDPNQMSDCPFMTWAWKLKQRFYHIKSKQVLTLQLSTWHESNPTSRVEYRFSARWLINAAFRMFHHSNAYKSKAIHLKIPNEFLSLKGQTGSRECQSFRFPVKTKEEEQRTFDYDFHKTINRKKQTTTKKRSTQMIWKPFVL